MEHNFRAVVCFLRNTFLFQIQNGRSQNFQQKEASFLHLKKCGLLSLRFRLSQELETIEETVKTALFFDICLDELSTNVPLLEVADFCTPLGGIPFLLVEGVNV